MDFSLLTYNTLFNDGIKGLHKICAAQHPDLICFQELDNSETTFKQVESLGYKLADYSNAFIKYGKIFGVATFYRPEKFHYLESGIILLPKGFIEFIAYILRIFKTGNKARTVLKTEFESKKNGKKIIIYNIHLSAHGTNNIRIKQLQKTLEDVKQENPQDVIILTGDFNYPIGRKHLEKMMREYQFKEATDSILFTTEGKMMHYTFFEKIFAVPFFKFMKHRLKLDYIFYRNCTSVITKKVDVKMSDHYPVYAVFKLV